MEFREQLGAKRTCLMGNGMVLEEIIVGWQEPQMYAYAGLDNNHPFGMRQHLSVSSCAALSAESTHLTWQHYFHHANAAAMCLQLDQGAQNETH